jgi:hypothetical protein
MWFAQNNCSHSKTQPMTNTTLDVHSGLPFDTFNYIIMLIPLMLIHCQFAALAQKGSY